MGVGVASFFFMAVLYLNDALGKVDFENGWWLLLVSYKNTL